MRSAKPKPIFRGRTIAAVGHLGGSEKWTDDNIARWIGWRKGKFVRDERQIREMLGEGQITHLICTTKEFRRMGSLVKAALKRKSCQIVTLDWLEDSMMKQKRLPEEPYSHRVALEKERELEKNRQKVAKGLEKAVKEVDPNFYHVYHDHTYFKYEVVLTRDNEDAGIEGERYILTINESINAKPHLYWFVAKHYKKKGTAVSETHRPSHAPGVFAREFALFESFFKKKAKIPWAQRLVKAGMGGKDAFQYQPPTGGKPVGWVPPEYMPAEIPVIGATNGCGSTPLTADSDTGTAPATNTSGSDDDTDSKIASVAAKISDASSQAEHFITPAPSPRADLSITVAPFPQNGDDNHDTCGPSLMPAPAVSWSTPGTTPCMMDLTGSA